MDTTFFMESLTPKPVTKRAVHPQIPTIIIKNLFLYLKTFLMETFCRNFSLFQINVIFSRNILLPEDGALGLMS